jgi:hypothetical protein
MKVAFNKPARGEHWSGWLCHWAEASYFITTVFGIELTNTVFNSINSYVLYTIQKIHEP